MLIRQTPDWQLPGSDITPESVYLNRRQLLGAMGLAGIGGLLGSGPTIAAGRAYRQETERPDTPVFLMQKIAARTVRGNETGEVLTPFNDASHYNNFYEFGLEKADPAEKARNFQPHPWQVNVSGECSKPGNYTLEDVLKPHTLEDRIYRFRCVEAWSMVIPWLGFPLRDLIERFQPTSRARFVVFTTLHDEQRMPMQRGHALPWPYLEALRMDEAMQPLTLLTVGMYGRSLPPQNGAPLRLIVPWKYGFKSIKSIVRIQFSEKAPITTWNRTAPDEYGFYANVNPAVDHPRWSQANERRFPSSLLTTNWRETLPFNGYGTQVASLYKGMDLRKFF